MKKICLMALFFLPNYAQESLPFFQDLPEVFIETTGLRLIETQVSRTTMLEGLALDRFLDLVPDESQKVGKMLQLPAPQGGFERYEIWYSSIMEAPLAHKYPEIKTFKLKGIDDPRATGRCDWTPNGFHAMLRTSMGTWYVDPYAVGDTRYYQSYWKKDLRRTDGSGFSCFFDDSESDEMPRTVPGQHRATGGELYTYRAAVAATGEYTNVFGGTVNQGLAEVVTAMNRVNEVYETDVAIRMILVANNDQIIYTNATTDPYNNTNPSSLLSQNQSNLDTVIGSSNYDIGHVFSTGGGGLASLAVVCRNGQKARGETGLPNPVGDGFYIDFVAHEMGHQWGGPHTFNGTTGNCGGGNRSAGSAYEPGSGSTIMAYAGICGSQDLQPHSDPNFHNKSYQDIITHSRTTVAGCAVILNSSNQAPDADAGQAYTIPAQTPFMLTGSATDPDGTSGLTYQWEQYDLGAASPPDTDDGSRPIFRSFVPTTNPVRYFPKLSDLLNQTTTIGESLPTTNRTLTFRLMVRDNDRSGAGTDFDEVALTVSAAAGPFRVTSQSTTVSYDGNSPQTVTWDVANTDGGTVNAANVDILFSSDGGATFDTLLLAATPNDGSAAVTIPNLNTSNGRIMVRGTNNIFMDINHAVITVQEQQLACTSDYDTWREATAGQYLDTFVNGVVDIIDILSCLGI